MVFLSKSPASMVMHRKKTTIKPAKDMVESPMSTATLPGSQENIPVKIMFAENRITPMNKMP